MDKKRLQATFREWKKAAQADYAITAPDSLGDCMSCVNAALCDKYGEDSTGIWAKEWKHGINGGSDIERLDEVCIAHDITEEQADIFYKTFGKDYFITPATYTPSRCFILYEKNTDVYEVSYKGTWNGEEQTYTDTYAGYDKALRRVYILIGYGKTVEIKRLFERER